MYNNYKTVEEKEAEIPELVELKTFVDKDLIAHANKYKIVEKELPLDFNVEDYFKDLDKILNKWNNCHNTIVKQKKKTTKDSNTQKVKRSFMGTVQFAHEIDNIDESKDILINGIEKYLNKNVKNTNFKRTMACIEYGSTGKRPHSHFCFSLTDDITKLTRLKPAECRNSLLRIFKNYKMDIRIEKGQQNIDPAVEYVGKSEQEKYGNALIPEKIIFCNTINGKEI